MDSLQCQHGDEATFIRLSGNQYRGIVPGVHSQFTGFEIEIAVCGGVFTVVALQTVDDQERSDVLFEINLPGGNGSGPGRQIVFAGLRLNDNEDGNDGEDRNESDGTAKHGVHENRKGEFRIALGSGSRRVHFRGVRFGGISRVRSRLSPAG